MCNTKLEEDDNILEMYNTKLEEDDNSTTDSCDELSHQHSFGVARRCSTSLDYQVKSAGAYVVPRLLGVVERRCFALIFGKRGSSGWASELVLLYLFSWCEGFRKNWEERSSQ